MLWDLLSLVAGGCALLSSLEEGWNAGGIGILIGLLVGLVLGIGVFWAMLKIGEWVVVRLNLGDSDLPPFKLILSWLLIVFAGVSIVLAVPLGKYVTKGALTLCLPQYSQVSSETLLRK